MEQEHEDKLFNLQLMIQKLEEELTLYRNGASGQELFEVIGEKTSEINDLKLELSQKSDSLKKLAKSSTDVLSRYSTLQESFDNMRKEKDRIDAMNATQLQRTRELEDELSAAVEALRRSQEENNAKQHALVQLEHELIDANVVIEKLHKRGATLVAEKTEKSKLLDCEKYQRVENENHLQSELTKIKRQYDHELNEKLKLKKLYEDSQQIIRDVRHAIATAQKTNEVAQADMKKIQTSYEAKLQLLNEKLQGLETEKQETEDSLIKMKSECEKLGVALSQQALRHSKELQSREDHWLNEHKKLQRLSETAQIRLGKLEGDKEFSISSKRECDILRARNLELEEKIRRIEQQQKSRFLRDKTNSLSDDNVGSLIFLSTAKTIPTPVIPSGELSSTLVHPVGQSQAPILPMHHRNLPSANSNARINSSSKLHEPGCSISNHR